MTTSDYIAIISISITTIVLIVDGTSAVTNNTKKFKLAEAHKKEILEWYSSTVHILTNIIAKAESINYRHLLSALSAQIEVGRFYFPNVVKSGNFGRDKPSAYQGYIHIVLLYYDEIDGLQLSDIGIKYCGDTILDNGSMIIIGKFM